MWKKGQSLLEVVFATTIVALVLTAIAASMTMSLKTSVESKYIGFADYLAQDSQEFFHRERVKLGWAEFKENIVQVSSTVCLNSIPANLVDILGFEDICSSGIGIAEMNNEFFRSVRFELPDDDTIIIYTKVTWFDGNKEKESELRTIFNDQTAALTGAIPTPLPTPVSTPGPTPLPTPAPITIASARASSEYPGFPATNAIDHNLGTGWNAGAGAPSWIHLDLGQYMNISEIRLHINQVPDGYTNHLINGSAFWWPNVTIAQFAGNTYSGQVLTHVFNPPTQPMRYLLIYTAQSPSWVSWFEIEVFAEVTNPKPTVQQLLVGKYIGLISSSAGNKYVHCYGPDCVLATNSDVFGSQERFLVVDRGDGSVTFKSVYNQYWSPDLYNTRKLYVNKPYPAEQLWVDDAGDGTVSIRSILGTHVYANPAEMATDTDTIVEASEKFIPVFTTSF